MSPIVLVVFEKILYDETNKLDASQQIMVITKGQEIYYLLDLVTQNAILAVENAALKTALWEGLRRIREQTGNLCLSEQEINAVINSLVFPIEEKPMVENEIADIALIMKRLRESGERLNNCIVNSDYKVFYDYIATLKTETGALAATDRNFLSNELNLLRKMEDLTKGNLDKSLAECPEIRTLLKNSKILPPSISRGVPLGLNCYQLLRYLGRTDKVINYFLNNMSQ